MTAVLTFFMTFVMGMLGLHPITSGGSNPKTAGCSAAPVPVVMHQPWSVSVYGLTPNAIYYIRINYPRDPSNNAHPNWGVQTDATGAGTEYFQDTDVSPDLFLAPGSMKMDVYSDNTLDPNAKGRTGCRFMVVEA